MRQGHLSSFRDDVYLTLPQLPGVTALRANAHELPAFLADPGSIFRDNLNRWFQPNFRQSLQLPHQFTTVVMMQDAVRGRNYRIAFTCSFPEFSYGYPQFVR